MQIQWRPLLDKLHVPWIDRGPNTSRGHVNICCPLCGNDFGFHMGLAEDKEAFFCWRDSTHSGRSLRFLLSKLVEPVDDFSDLLEQYTSGESGSPQPPVKPVRRPTDTAWRWSTFASATESGGYMQSYLKSRGFDQPESVIGRYDLRFEFEGKWAQRLLIPIGDQTDVWGWTGRAVRPVIPKYLTQLDASAPSPLYLPRSIRRTLLIVEGPIDALKICCATERQTISAVALCGKALTDEKLLHLRSLLDVAVLRYPSVSIRVCPDSDTQISYNEQMLAWARWLHRKCQDVQSCYLPAGVKDAGEMSTFEIQQWLGA